MIPVSEPLLVGRELKYLWECLQTGWISSAGRFINEFEDQFAAYCGRKHAVAVSSGTAALQIAVDCLGLGPGDEVIVPTFTIISCAGAVVASGAKPVLVDCDPDTWTMNVSQVAERITDLTRAIMPVHIYGHPVDMDPIMELARRRKVAVIEDAAEAHGAEYKGRKCGSFGELSCFSFYANKIITTGEGGMVLTDDSGHAEKCRSLRNLCFGPERRFLHEDLGYNFRMTNMQAAVGLAQLERIEEHVKRKREIASLYAGSLRDIELLQLPREEVWAKNVYWMYGVVLDKNSGMDACEFARRLLERGVQSRPFFLGMHRQPALHKRGLFIDESYPVADRLTEQGLYLPCGLAVTDKQLLHVCDVIHDVVTGQGVGHGH